jgi:uncharacterized membrane protein
VPDAGARANGERVGRLVGATLIAEGVLVAILRLLSLVYAVASEAYNADRFRTPLSNYLPWVLLSILVAFGLVWAGSFLRREPTGAWVDVGLDARVVLVVAGVLNLMVLVVAVSGLVRGPATVEGVLTWMAIVVTSLVVIAGLVMDVRRSRSRA